MNKLPEWWNDDKSYKIMNCLDGMKELPDNCIDAIVTDPPYFLVNNSGFGFMGKKWDSLNISNAYSIVCKSNEIAKTVVRFFMSCRAESNLEEVNIVQENVNMHLNQAKTKSIVNVQCVEKNSHDIKAKSLANINSVHGIVLTKVEVLDMLKESYPNHMTVIENQNENVLFAVPISFIEKNLKNTVAEHVLKFPIEGICSEKETHLLLMEEVRIKNVIGGMIGNILENEYMNEIIIPANTVENTVKKRKYRHITNENIVKHKIIQWITLLLYVTNVTPESKQEFIQSLIVQFHKNWTIQAIRVLKPGGYLLSFAGTRTHHHMTQAIEDAGFEIRDMICWVYGSGFPKSHNIGKSVDKLQGNEREIVGEKIRGNVEKAKHGVTFAGADANKNNKCIFGYGKEILTKGVTQWEGWGTALKPAMEPITVARKPLGEKTVAKNVLKWETGGINIDGCRVEYLNNDDNRIGKNYSHKAKSGLEIGKNKNNSSGEIQQLHNTKGRFPANLIHDGSEEVLDLFPDTKSGSGNGNASIGEPGNVTPLRRGKLIPRNDSGSASRFFYLAKTSKSERNVGCENLYWLDGKLIEHHLWQTLTDENEQHKNEKSWKQHNVSNGNIHPTVKPLKLIEYLVRLVTPPKGVVLDPFLGSGTTIVACQNEGFIGLGFEMSDEYADIIDCRINNKEITKDEQIEIQSMDKFW